VTAGDEGLHPERRVRYWPPAPLPPDPCIETSCGACGMDWLIGLKMAGHRLRCECGNWIDVPSLPSESGALSRPEQDLAILSPRSVRTSSQIDVTVGYREAPGPMDRVHDIPTTVPMEAGTLRHANLDTKRRWTTRVVFELAAVVLAFWIPSLLIFLWAGDDRSLLYTPLADLASGLLVLLIGAGAVHYTFSGLKRPKPLWAYAEAVGAAAGFLALVALWFRFLEDGLGYDFGPDPLRQYREVLGWGWAFAVIAIFPAIFEELAFRGLVQGRLAAMRGRNGSIVTTGALFALAHGVGFGFPFHVLGGFYLCWLRARCDSLYPGMLMHMLYNGALLAIYGS
jgi:membrane protease YdiL (CAAX protease family)